jgi:hypothetical protein
LVAEVLAGSAYPEQISAADAWLAQHAELKDNGLVQAVDRQPWDASIKSLTGFRSVLEQMAKNPSWTRALGEAYANDPTDVMNAIQVMRQRADANGALKSDGRQRVSTEPRVSTPAAASDISANRAADRTVNPPADVADGFLIVPPPQTIVIEPAQAGMVYVPMYNPTVVYGMPLPLYPGYIYAPPPYNALATGLISFGVGVAIGAALENHYNWGWHAWGAHWGPGYAGGWVGHGAGIGYHHAPYVSHSTTIINHGAMINHTTHVSGGRVWDRPDFGHDVDRHLIDTGPAHGSDWANHRNGPDFQPTLPVHPVIPPNLERSGSAARANLTQSGKDFGQSARNAGNGVARAGQAAGPLDQRTALGQMHEPIARPANAPEGQARAAAMQANHSNFQPGLARPATSMTHAPALASARTAPLSSRGEGENRLGGFGFHGRR